jgi:hypothetical protein
VKRIEPKSCLVVTKEPGHIKVIKKGGFSIFTKSHLNDYCLLKERYFLQPFQNSSTSHTNLPVLIQFTMKLSLINFSFALAASLLTFASAQNASAVNKPTPGTILQLYVRTTRYWKSTDTPQLKEDITTGMKAIQSELTALVLDVIPDVSVGKPSNRQLRAHDSRNLQSCKCAGVAGSGCWVFGVWVDKCRRELQLHEDYSDEDFAELSEEDQSRHLSVSEICKEARDIISDAIIKSPRVPSNGTFVQQCFYEIA